MSEEPAASAADLLYVGFNGRVVALDQNTGELVWEWDLPAPSFRQMVAVLVEGERVFVSSAGYTYCLDAVTGAPVWENPLKGFGTGVPCLATVNASLSGSFLLHAQELANQQAGAAGAGAARAS